jgi:hypothetical protein
LRASDLFWPVDPLPLWEDVVMSQERRCEGCKAKMEASEYLRNTWCTDGVLRRLCEECALDEFARIREADRQKKQGVA